MAIAADAVHAVVGPGVAVTVTLPVERGQPVCAIVSVGSAIAAGAVGSGGETAQPVVAVVDEIRIAGQRGNVAEKVVGVAVVETLARACAQPHPEALQLAAVARRSMKDEREIPLFMIDADVCTVSTWFVLNSRALSRATSRLIALAHSHA